MTVELGKPKYEQGSKNYFTFKKDQNHFVLRILPPMGDLAKSGKWSVYHRVEFGYKGTDGRMKPFLSPRKVNFNTKMVEVESEAHVRREKIKQQAEAAKASGNTEVEEQCKKLLRQYNQDAKHYMNVVDLQGNVGLFKIGHRGYQALKAEIDRLRSTGVDPIGIENGRFFVFSRSGKGRDTIYTVNEYKQKQTMDVNGTQTVVDAPFPHTIDDSIMAKLETDAFELDKVYPSVTPEEEHKIVHEGPAGVDAVFGAKTNAKKSESTQQTAQSVEHPVSTEPAPAAEVTTTEGPAQTVAADTPATAPEATSADAPAQTTTGAASTQNLSQMSDDEFMKAIENGDL